MEYRAFSRLHHGTSVEMIRPNMAGSYRNQRRIIEEMRAKHESFFRYLALHGDTVFDPGTVERLIVLQCRADIIAERTAAAAPSAEECAESNDSPSVPHNDALSDHVLFHPDDRIFQHRNMSRRLLELSMRA